MKIYLQMKANWDSMNTNLNKLCRLRVRLQLHSILRRSNASVWRQCHTVHANKVDRPSVPWSYQCLYPRLYEILTIASDLLSSFQIPALSISDSFIDRYKMVFPNKCIHILLAWNNSPKTKFNLTSVWNKKASHYLIEAEVAQYILLNFISQRAQKFH